MIAIIGGVYTYLIEAQIGDDENIALRVFEYGMAEGLRARKMSGEKNAERITVKFPEARIIYWETTSRTPDEVILSLEFSDGGHYDYSVRTLKFLDHEITELEGRKLAILLPFYVLKLRKRVVSAKTALERSKLGREAKGILDELMAATERAKASGSIGENDWLSILEHMERIYSELYGCYDEFKEVDAVLQEKILTYTEEAKLIGIQEGIERGIERGIAKGIERGKVDMARNLLRNGVMPDVIARSSGLPMEKIRDLMN
jgi:predicted transposase/invertase (TIGR01784 family)